MANARTPRDAWIDQGLHALAAGGPDAVRVETLAQALGVTKGGFYGYFANRSALLEEMLDTWERDVTESVIRQVESVAGNADARTKLRRLFAVVAAADEESTINVPVALAVRDWARRDVNVARRLRRVDNRQMAYLRALFREFCVDEVDVEARCLIVMSLRIGDHLVPAEHAGCSRNEALSRALSQQLA